MFREFLKNSFGFNETHSATKRVFWRIFSKNYLHGVLLLTLLPTNCLSVFDHLMGLALKGLIISISIFRLYHSLRRILDHGLKQSAFSPILHPWYFVEEVIFSSYHSNTLGQVYFTPVLSDTRNIFARKNGSSKLISRSFAMLLKGPHKRSS